MSPADEVSFAHDVPSGCDPVCTYRLAPIESPSVRNDASVFYQARQTGKLPKSRMRYQVFDPWQALLQTVRDWPKDIYNLTAVIVAIHSELDSSASTSTFKSSTQETKLLMECLAEL